MHKLTEQVRKLVIIEKSLKNDSDEVNIQNEKATKKIHEAGNCELHEIQQRTNKVQCQCCYEAGFQVCPCGGKLNMSEEMLSYISQKCKQLIADACMPFHGTRRAKHGAQPWQKTTSKLRSLCERSEKKGTYSSILDRFQNDEVLHASQLRHNWTKEWCEYLDYIRTIDISHKALLDNWNDTPHWIIFGIIHNKWRKDLWKVVQVIIKLRGPVSA